PRKRSTPKKTPGHAGGFKRPDVCARRTGKASGEERLGVRTLAEPFGSCQRPVRPKLMPLRTAPRHGLSALRSASFEPPTARGFVAVRGRARAASRDPDARALSGS